MARWNEVRPGEEVAAHVPPAQDAGLIFIGVIHTPWKERSECPRQGSLDGPICTIELFDPWPAALDGLEVFERIQVLYWLHHARRDLIRQKRSADSEPRGTFALRSPMRPNPIGVSVVKLVAIEGRLLRVQGLDCLDRTPLIDVKPDRCAFSPEAAQATTDELTKP